MRKFRFASPAGIPDFSDMSLRELLSPPEAQGPEGRKLLELLEAAQKHMSRVMSYGANELALPASAVFLSADESIREAMEAAATKMIEGIEYPSELVMPRHVIRRHKAKLIRVNKPHQHLGLSQTDLSAINFGEEDGGQ